MDGPQSDEIPLGQFEQRVAQNGDPQRAPAKGPGDAGADALARLDLGIRRRYLNYDELTEQLHRWARAFPEIAHLTSLGQSPGGRELWLLTVGRDHTRTRPAVWIDGNMHAPELAGSAVALAIAEDALRLHLAPDDDLHGLRDHNTEALRGLLFHVMPRVSPDGAEVVLTTGRYVRSVPRDPRADSQTAHWVAEDVDGDGLALWMRIADPGGEYVETPEVPHLMRPRTIDDAGPFYKVYPEGVIAGFDGQTIPEPGFLADNGPDLNRNFPWDWRPEPTQVGAGAYPASEVESRAIVEFAEHHPNIFAWLNLHTFGGVYIRPLGDADDAKMNQRDLAVFRQLGAWGRAASGYPMVSGFEQFTYEPEKPIYGDLSAYAYHQRGAIAFVCELWDLFHRAGLPRQQRFVDHYTHLDSDDLLAVGRYVHEHCDGLVLRPWRAIDHPQLGAVEVGGIDPRFGLWNPPPSRIEEVAAGQCPLLFRMAAMAPRLEVANVERIDLGGETTCVELVIENHGYLATHGIDSAKDLPFNEPLWAIATTRGCALANRDDARRPIGHLDGWGRGLFPGEGALYYMKSRGSTNRRTLRYVVVGKGELEVRVGCPRMGEVTTTVTID